MSSKNIKNINSIFGIGTNTYKNAIKYSGLNSRKIPNSISINNSKLLHETLRKKKTLKSLKTEISKFLNLYIEIKSYRGIRHKYHYPVRGQRTHTNARTCRKKLHKMYIVTK